MAEIVDVLLRARMEASGVEAGVGQIQKSLQGLTLPKGISNELEKSFSKLTPLLKDYQKQLNKGFSNKKDLQNFNALKEKISETFGEIRSQVQSVNSQEIRLKVDTQEIDKLENQIVSKTAKLQEALSKVFTKTVNTESIKEQLDKVISNTGKAATVKPMADLAKQLFNNQDYAAYNNKIDEIKNKILSLKTTKVDLATALGVKDAATNIDVANDKIEKFFNNLKVNEGKVQTIEHLKQELQELGVNLENVKLESLTKGTGELQGVEGLIEQLADSIRDTGNAAGEAGQSMVRMVDEVNDLKTSTQYFFSLRNMINLLKRGIDDAVQSVKELDKAMTETAVVTDFSVADMWKDLPKYTQIANELGATTQGAYETMTLYYQQGLNQQQAFELGAETMKMARIAGLDYAETTDMMTAALRGFNMELDETSAKRVNDVYSKLAAVTASDTEELGTAMQRTASIAHSAGMSFEGTTAFLAQAIETTREPAENIGTAMKTIVARFQEMKKNPLEISEVDGEEVSYNKVDQALQSIGVSLKDTNGQFRELDQVFLDISSRWDSLSQVQQRYIATTAAGSRQQSRFIAMMDNYDRTMQLMEAATDSAGASDEQFGKTMDSLESKLNKLHNAWQAFTMGIANNNMIKLAVDGLTGFLTITNKIIDTLSLGSGAIKSFLSVFAAFTGLKTGGKAINALIGGLGGLVDPQKTFKEGLKTGFFGSGRDQLQADRISNPIVNAINGLIPHIQGRTSKDTVGTFKFTKDGSYNAARAGLNDKLGFKGLGFGKGNGTYSINNIRTILKDNQLTPEQQKEFFQSSPGFKKNITNSLASLMQEAGADPKVTQGVIKGFQQGTLTLDEALLEGGLGQSFSSEMQKGGLKAGKAFVKANREQIKALREEAKQRGLTKAEQKEYVRKSIIPTDAAKEGLDAEQQLSTSEKIANGFGKAGAAMTSFGSTLQMVGANLAAVNPQLGQFVSGLGNMMTTAGSAISALSSLANPIVLIGAAIGAAIYVDQKRLQGIRDTADKVTESYKNIHDQTTENINNLKSYQNEFASLVQGVDRNGNNVNLDTTQYDRYLEIVDEIARLNPEIVEGYNAQGHAIITNNEALDETIKKQKQLQDEATKKYLEDDSLDKLIKARDINNDYIDSLIDKKTKGQIQKTYGKVNDQTISQFMGKQTALSPQAMAIGKQIEKSDLYKENKQAVNEILGQYDITLADLEAGEQKAVNVFKAHSADIKSQLATAAGIADVEFSDKFNTAFDQWDTSLSSFNESIEGIYQNLSTSISSSGLYDEIDTKLRPAFQAGLKDIAATGDTAKQMKADAAALATEFSNLTNSSSDYAQAMEQVEQLQDQFANDLDADAYTKAINAEDGPIAVLNEQLELLEGRTDAAAQAQREFLENEIDSITKFTESSFGSLTSALNTLQDDIAEAEGAFETFSKSVESDYSTAVKGMQSIYDKVFEELDIEGSTKKLHTQGYGDKTFWAGAEALLGQDAVSKKGVDVNSITKQMERLKPALQQGEAGYYGFLDLINTKYQNANEKTKTQMENLIGTFKDGRLDEFHIDQDSFSEVAKLLEMSDNSLTSMLHNAMQFADLDFMDADAVRKTLATSNEAIAGEGTTGGKQNLFVSEDYLRQQVLDAGYRPEKVEGILDKLDKQGIKTIPSAKELGSGTSAYFKDNLGVNNQKQLIETLNATGTFNREQIAEYAKNMMGEKVFDPKQFAQDYNDVINAQEHPIDTAQLNELTSIHSIIANILAHLDPEHNDSIYDTNEQFRKLVEGERGVNDTVGEKFALGLDENNNPLTGESYKNATANLQEIINGIDTTITQLKTEAQTASGEQLDFLNKQIEGLEASKKITEEQLNSGKQAYQQLQKNAQTENEKYKNRNTTSASQENLKYKNRSDAEKGSQTVASNTETKTTHLTVDDDASSVIDEAQDKADTFDNTKAEADVTADTADANKNLEKTEDKLNTLDGKKAETKVTTTTEEPKAPTVPTNTTATVSITGDNQQAMASAQQAVSTINGLQSKIIVGANTDAALAKARGLARTISGLSAKVKVTAYYSGGTITIPTKANPIKPHTGGLVVPGGPIYRAKGGSIFKPKGTDTIPAMLTPGEYVQKRDAVEYFGVDFMRQINHKNLSGALASLKGKTNYRSSGGMISYYGDGGNVNGKVKYDWGGGNSSGSSSSSGKNKTPKSDSTNDKKDKKEIATAKKVFDWWEKISRQVKSAQKKSEKLGNQLTKIFKDIRASINDVNAINKKFIATQNKIISLNQEIATTSTSKLNGLTTGSSKTKIKYKKNGKEKTKKVKLSKYINYDEATDSYYVNEKAINNKKNGSKALRKAIQEKAYELIDKYQGRKDEAEANITKAQDELADYRKQIDDAFFGWKNELTQVLRITSEIERTEAKINDLKARQERTQFYLDNVDLSMGTEGTDLQKYFKELGTQTEKNIKLNNDENKLKYNQIDANKKEMASMGELTDNVVSYEDINGKLQKQTERALYNRIENIDKNGTGTGWDELSSQEKKIYARNKAFQLGIIKGNPNEGYSLSEQGLNTYLAAIENGKIQEELGSLLKEVWDDLNEKTLENINLQTEIYSTENDNLKLYQDYQDTAKQISEQLYGWENTLTKVLELTNKIEQSEKRLSYLKATDEFFNNQILSGQSVSTADILTTYIGQIIEAVSEIENLGSKLGEQRINLQSYLTGEDIYKQVDNLSAQAPTEANIARLEELQKQLEIRRLALNYGTITQNADGTVSTTYDSAKIEKDLGSKFDAETAKEIVQFYQDLNEKSEDIRNTMQSSLDKISELQQSLIDLRQSYADSAEKLLSAYVNQQQKVIDNMKTLYSNIDSHFKELISDIKQTLQLARQNQDNVKTEEDISKKQQRLGMLQADTSGGNQVAIAQLQKEITDAQQSYGRTLEDQLLDKISVQGDVAARQRQRQIDLMQAQHDIAKNTGIYVAQIDQWLSDPAGFRNTIVGILTQEAGVKAMTAEKRAITLSEIDKEVAEFTTFPGKIDATTNAINSLQTLIKGGEENGEGGLANEIGNTITTSISSISDDLAKKFFGDPDKKGDTGALGGLKTAVEGISSPITQALKTGIEEKLFGKEGDKKDIGAFGNLNNNIGTNTTSINSLNNSIGTNTTSINSLNNSIGTNTTSINSLSNKIKDLHDKIDDLKVEAEVQISIEDLTPTTKVTTDTAPTQIESPQSNSPSEPLVQTVQTTNTQSNTERDKAYAEFLQNITRINNLTTRLNELQKKRTTYTLKHKFDLAASIVPAINSTQRQIDEYTEANKKLHTKYGFKTGGLADYTGPAWLDGTPSKPELVLNAKDTQNFLALRDVLSKAIGSTSSVTNSYGGDNIFEINVNVDKIEKDYDVDRVIEKVKKEITKGAGYRNVTQVRNFR